MGRRRKHDRHLPQRVYLRRGVYYFVTLDGRWEPLGRDLSEALAEYGRMVGGAWSGRTMGDIIDRYRVEVLPLKKSAHTRALEGPQLGRLRAVFGDMHPDSITAQQLYRYLDQRRDKQGRPAPSAARHEIALLGHVFGRAVRWGLAAGNPVRQLQKEAPRPRAGRYVTDDEFDAVRAAGSERLRVAMDLALLTGLRRSDVLGLTRECITPAGLVVQTQKTGQALQFDWTPALRDAVERARRLKPQVPGHYLVRSRTGQPYSPTGFAAIFKRAVAKAGVAPFTFHDIRRKSASDSADLAEASARLGHTSQAVTVRHYIRKARKVTPLR